MGDTVTSARKQLLVSAFTAAAFCAPLAISSPVTGQTQSPSGARPSFDVASIKERDARVPLGLVGIQVLPGRVNSRCASLYTLVFFAYNLTLASPINGLPNWADAPCSDGSSANTYEVQATMPPDTTRAQAQLMMQTLLAERFKLLVHSETKTMSVLALVVGVGGFKPKPSDPDNDPPRAPGSLGCPPDDRACRMLVLGSAPVSALAQLLSNSLGRPVIDKTGLSGTYDFNVLKWAGDNSSGSPLPSLPTAVKEAFGLELKSENSAIEILVIDRAEKPSSN
jgi:uncharacterized protein (TIGR03435 family)